MRSSSGREVYHRFTNEGSSPLDLVWVDYDGNEKGFGTLQPSESRVQHTFDSHPWRLRVAGSGALAAEYVGPSATLSVSDCRACQTVPGLRRRREEGLVDSRWGRYRSRAQSRHGFEVWAWDCVGEEAVRIAAYTLGEVMSDAPADVVARMRYFDVRLAVIGRDQGTCDVPEHGRIVGRETDGRTRGLGATINVPVSSVGEENLTMVGEHRYASESILVHEWAHAVMELGLAGHPWKTEIAEAWAEAKQRGMYRPDSYIISNDAEYWAEASQAWFDATVRQDATSGIISRDIVKRHDPRLAAVLAKVYGDGPWRYQHTCPGLFYGVAQRPTPPVCSTQGSAGYASGPGAAQPPYAQSGSQQHASAPSPSYSPASRRLPMTMNSAKRIFDRTAGVVHRLANEIFK